MTMSTFVIAEAGVNHNGSLDLAKKMIEVAADAGVDAVKFQTFRAENLVSRSAAKAHYQSLNTGPGESQFDMLKKLELDEAQHRALSECCRGAKIEFLSSPFDPVCVRFLTQTLNVPRLKIPSGELTNALLLLEVAKSGKPALLSTGMGTLEEIGEALGILAFGYTSPDVIPCLAGFREAYHSPQGLAALLRHVTLLQCTSEYPAPFEDVHLRAMEALHCHYGLPVGFSDHTSGIAVAIAAAARGAVVIEKHFTLDRAMPGPDHQASLEPSELKLMVQSIREVEKALGMEQKNPADSELKNRQAARRGLVAACDIRRGEKFDEKNLTVKRPEAGISAIQYWDWIGKMAGRDYVKDEVI